MTFVLPDGFARHITEEQGLVKFIRYTAQLPCTGEKKQSNGNHDPFALLREACHWESGRQRVALSSAGLSAEIRLTGAGREARRRGGLHARRLLWSFYLAGRAVVAQIAEDVDLFPCVLPRKPRQRVGDDVAVVQIAD